MVRTEIRTEYLQNIINKKVNEEIAFFEKSKENLELSFGKASVNLILGIVTLHICLRYDSDALVNLIFIALIIPIRLIARYFLNKKLDNLVLRWDKFQELIDRVSTLMIYENLPNGIIQSIENDMSQISVKKKHTFWDSDGVNATIHSICLISGLIVYHACTADFFAASILSLFFCIFAANAIIDIKRIILV